VPSTQSKAKRGEGNAPAAVTLAAGIHVGWGIDGAATNNNRDLWEELRLAPLLAKVSSLDPKPVPAGEALWMATRLGALAIHQPTLGVLAEGMQADLISLEVTDTAFVPLFTPETYISHLVYATHRPVHSVWVAGERVVKDGDIMHFRFAV